MTKLSIQKHKLPFGDYVKCDMCSYDWNEYITIIIFDHEITICPDCFDDFKDKIKKIA